MPACENGGCAWNNSLAHAVFEETVEKVGKEVALQNLRQDVKSWIHERKGESFSWTLRVQGAKLVAENGKTLDQMTTDLLIGPNSHLVSESIKETARYYDIPTQKRVQELASQGAETIVHPEHHQDVQGNTVVRYFDVLSRDKNDPKLYHGSRIDLRRSFAINEARTRIASVTSVDDSIIFHRTRQENAFVLSTATPKVEEIKQKLVSAVVTPYLEKRAVAKPRVKEDIRVKQQQSMTFVLDRSINSRGVESVPRQVVHAVIRDVTQTSMRAAVETIHAVEKIVVAGVKRKKEKQKEIEGKPREQKHVVLKKDVKIHTEKRNRKPKKRILIEAARKIFTQEKKKKRIRRLHTSKSEFQASNPRGTIFVRETHGSRDGKMHKEEIQRMKERMKKMKKRSVFSEVIPNVVLAKKLEMRILPPKERKKRRKLEQKAKRKFLLEQVDRVFPSKHVEVRHVLQKEKKMEKKKQRRLAILFSRLVRRINTLEKLKLIDVAPKESQRAEKKIPRERKREVTLRFSFAWTLWVLLQTLQRELAPDALMNFQYQRFHVSIDESAQKEPTPWVLFAIIWYLAAIREHGLPISKILGPSAGAGKYQKSKRHIKKRKVKQRKRLQIGFPSYLPQTGVIFAFIPMNS